MALRTLPDSARTEKPLFSLARGAATDTSPPPYDFEDVTLRFFPLKANFHTLSLFVDEYLNVVPKEFGYFRPAMPFVLLCFVNYGRMAPGAGNLGWIAQNEVLFAVPLEQYVFENGTYVYKDIAQVSPFIWVDSEGSQIGGREVFGWPKVQGWYGTGPGSWSRHPRSPLDLVSLNTRVFEELYEDHEDVPRELLTIREEPAPSYSEMPPEPNSPFNPWSNLSKAIGGWSDMFTRTLDMMLTLPSRGYETVDGLPGMSSGMGSMDLLTQRMQANTINFKQMRNAGTPRFACYQALTSAQMEVAQIRRFGLLGDLALLRGDLSGGFAVRLHRYESLPIIETLGLEIHREIEDGNSSIAELKPVMPFWQQMDMKYLTGRNLCWRTLGSPWRNDEFEAVDDEAVAEPAQVDHASVEEPAPVDETIPSEDQLMFDWLYNTTGSSGLQVATGPFQFHEASVRVLPLLADPAQLQRVVDAQLNKVGKNGLTFDVWGSYVYLMVSTYGDMYSETNDMGEWADRQVEFAVPVRCYDVVPGGKRELLMAGFFSPFIYSDSTISATTGREVYGWSVQKAAIANAQGTWLNTTGPFPSVTPLLKLETDVYPALFLGQENDWRTLIEIEDGHPVESATDWNYIAQGWGRRAKHSVEKLALGAKQDAERYKHLQALGLEMLANREPINQVSFKQFRDASEPTNACYQALVNRRWRIRRLFELREIDDLTHVKIHSYENQPIVKELGLRTKASWTTEKGYVDAIQPIRPFFLKAHLEADDGENLAVRADSRTWQRKQAADREFLNGIVPTVHADLVDGVDAEPHDLRGQALRWRDGTGTPMSIEEASEAVLSEHLEPQSVINHALSARWGAAQREDDPRVSKPDFVLRRDCVGPAQESLFGPDDDHETWSPDRL